MSTRLALSLRLEAIGREQAPVLENLFELYCYDFSEHVPLDLKPSGRFEIPVSEAWWTHDDHFPFLIREGINLVGFALARQGSRVSAATNVMDVAEFFVVRGARARGLGTQAAHALFTRFPQAWEIRVRVSNVPAQTFWSRVVEEWLGEAVEPRPFTHEGVAWNVLSIPARLETSCRSSIAENLPSG
ncbi:MAG: GNAT family N-acetyltransferase [Polyangiaceae bacterium]